jgi:ketosteroid isomerase-like protein
MRTIVLSIIAVLILCPGVRAQTAPDAAELTKLLNDFLAGASTNDAAMHERFWADDLIYTAAVGRRVSKADIMADLRKSPAATLPTTRTTYTAEEIRIQQYGNTAIVAFQLVATTKGNKNPDVSKYFNTGTFLKRAGKWQVVAWQATRLPRPDETGKRDVASTEAELQKAMLASDVDALERILDESFIWTQDTGAQTTRQQLIDNLKTGRLKYSKTETNNVTVSVSGDTGVVRGVTARQRSAIPGQTGTGDAAPFTAFYTLTFVNKGGPWKAVAMHTSRQ